MKSPSSANHKFPKEPVMQDYPKMASLSQDGYPQGYDHNLKVQDKSVAMARDKVKAGGVSSF